MKPLPAIIVITLAVNGCHTSQKVQKREPAFSDISSGQAEMLSKKLLVQYGETISYDMNGSKVINGETIDEETLYDYWFVVFPPRNVTREVEYLIVIMKETGKIKYAGPHLEGESYLNVVGDQIQ